MPIAGSALTPHAQKLLDSIQPRPRLSAGAMATTDGITPQVLVTDSCNSSWSDAARTWNLQKKQMKSLSTDAQNHMDHGTVVGSPKKIFSLYVIGFLILATLIAGFIWHDLGADYRDTLSYWNVQLSSSADEWVRVSALWLKERWTDTRGVAQNPSTIRLLSAGKSKRQAAELRQQVEGEIAHMAAVNGFRGGAVGDADCRITVQSGLRPEMARDFQEACRVVQRTGEFRIDLFGMEQGRVWLKFTAPVMAEGPASSSGPITRRRVGCVIMVVENLQDSILIFGGESVGARTSETLLVWRELGEALIFSAHRSAQGVESLFRRPLAASTLESRVARDGEVAFGEFMDYRGVGVFGAARRIGPHMASLACKVDREEALSAYHRHRVLDGLVGTLTLLLLGTVMVAVHRHAAARDLQERLRQQKALLELKQHIEVSEARFRELVETAEAIVWEADVATQKITFVSQGAEKILGYSTDQWLRTAGFWTDHIYPQDRVEALACERAVTEKGQPRSAEYRMQAADGRVLWFRDFMHAVFGAEGKAERLRGIMVDITESKRAEEELVLLKRSIDVHYDGAYWTDTDDRFIYINDAGCKALGYAREELIGKRLLDVNPKASPERMQVVWQSLRSQGFYSSSSVHRRKDGSEFPVEVVVTYVQSGGDEFACGFARDITERQRAEEERQRSFDQLRGLAARLQSIREEERKRVAREIHDQLGQALTAIKIDLSSLVRELPPGEKQPSKRTASILQLVDESIKSVRRISTDLRPGILDDLGLVAAIEWAGEDFESRTGTPCRLDLPQEGIAADTESATAIFRIFQETLTNVARHAEASQIDVRMAREGGDLTLEVYDNGKGITENQLSSRKSLGILGMRERAMLLGGALTISSPPGDGTTVKVRIPEAHRPQGEQDL